MEIFDLYNKNRMPLNTTMVRGTKPPKDSYRLAVHLCIFNNEEQMLIQHRQSFKDNWANYWDITIGGSAVSGDDSETAIKRELKEELGIDLADEDLRPYLTIHFDEGFDDIYLMEKEVDISTLELQHEEVQAVKWASRKEILDMIDNGDFIPYHRSLIDLLFYMRCRKNARTTN